MVVSASALISMRDMDARDVRAVRRIESAAYEDAWPARIFESELRNEFARYRVAVNSPGEIARSRLAALRRRLTGGRAERILGFLGVWYMVDQLHLVTIAVDPDEQGRGIGHRLLFDCFTLAAEAELPSIVLEVRVSNQRAQRLYERFGFRRVGTLRAYYRDNDEDAHVLQSGDPASAPLRAHLATLRGEWAARYGAAFAGSGAG